MLSYCSNFHSNTRATLKNYVLVDRRRLFKMVDSKRRRCEDKQKSESYFAVEIKASEPGLKADLKRHEEEEKRLRLLISECAEEGDEVCHAAYVRVLQTLLDSKAKLIEQISTKRQ